MEIVVTKQQKTHMLVCVAESYLTSHLIMLVSLILQCLV